MAFQNSRKESTALASFGDKIILNACYELTNNRVGVVKFIGKTQFKPGIEWFGVEITKGKGKNNGTVMGTSYFNCKKGQGAFVQLNHFLKRVSSKKGKTEKGVAKKAGSLATGRNKDYDAAKFKQEDTGNFLGEKNVKASEGGEVAKKDGAIATGKNEDYDAAEFKQKDDGSGFLAEKNVKASEGGEVAKKDGAIATGKNEDYDAANFKSDNDGKDFL